MKTVLVTAIGTVTMSTVVKELRRIGGYYIIGSDINNRNEIATSLEVDEYYKFPHSTNNDYLPFVLDFCKNHKIEYYFAAIDKEVAIISMARDKFREIGTKLCVPNFEFVKICHYKNLFNEWIYEHIPEIGIRTYRSVNDAKVAHYPLFIKPVEGVASVGCRRIDSVGELTTSIGPNEDSILIQDYVEGKNITVDCIRNKKTGQMIQVQRRELLRNANGCGIAVEIIRDKKLESICNYLMENLDLDGVANMEFFETEDGYKIIEINPRLSAGSIYSCMAGVNTVINSMRIADGDQCVFSEVPIGAHFAERYEAYRMD